MNASTVPGSSSELPCFPASIDLAQTMACAPPPLDFVLPGMIAATVGSLVSPGGVGKSFLSLQWAVLVATGYDMLGLGHDLPTGRVAMLCLEDPLDALKHRIFALGKHLTPDVRGLIEQRLDMYPLAGEGMDIFKKSHFEWILQHADGHRLMLLDTLRRVHNEDENDAARMTELLNRMEIVAKKTGCALLFLHHTTKASAMGGHADMQQASRGSSVLTDNIRWQSFLASMSKEEAAKAHIDEAERGRFVRFGIPKRNYGPPQPEMWLERGEGGILQPTLLPQLTQAAQQAQKKTRSSAAVRIANAQFVPRVL